jgi:polar amino acid transport system substrate-binding protein
VIRKTLLTIAVLGLVGAACAPEETVTASPGSPGADQCAVDNLALFQDGQLTIATGNPAYKPWYGGKSVPDSDWKAGAFTGDPHSGEGYESAFAYALAEQMGFADDQVEWLGIPLAKSFAPGPKDFDFAMQQISITDKRAEAVDFSEGYYNVNQALIANEGSPAIGVSTLAGLKDLKLGAPIGTTSLQAITELVQPNVEPSVYPDLDTALKDLKNGQVDGVVVDFPTAFYGYADTIVGQFPNIGGEQEQFGLAFEKGNTLVGCVNQAIEGLRDDGTLQELQDKWLKTDVNVPVFS